MPATLAERFVFGTADPKPATSVHIVPRMTTATIGRFALAALFLVAGFEKFADTGNTIAHMTAAGIPAAGVLVYVAAAIELAGAVSLALGAFTRVGAAMLSAYLGVVTLVFHAFWNYEDAERGRQLVNFLKNTAIIGGLFMILSHGPGRASVDARLRSSLVTLVIAVVALVGCRRDTPPPAAPTEPEPVVRTSPDPTQLARGSYVVALAGCKVCHAPTQTTIPNITPDPTGIGTWSDTQVITALRRGVKRDGTKLSPMMPYTYFHQMSDSDAKAVVTYLRNQPAIRYVVQRSEPSPDPIDLLEPVDNVDPIDDVQGHGEYLANLMHCGSCHTPRSGSHAHQLFAGGVAFESVTSANITSDPNVGIGQWTESEILAAVRTGDKPDGTEIVGPMRAYMPGWKQLDESDAHALAEYIKSVPAIHHEIPEQHAAYRVQRRRE